MENNEKKKSSFVTRAISCVLLLLGAILLLHFAESTAGNWIFRIFNWFIALVGTMELLRVVGCHKSVLAIANYLAITALYTFIYLNQQEYLIPLIILFLIFLFAVMVICFPRFSPEQIFTAFICIIYVGLGLSYLYQTRMNVENGRFIVWFIFAASWGSDTFAYIFGVTMGKHHPFPHLSPKKSIEGCIGGVAGAAVLTWIYCLVLEHGFGIWLMRPWKAAIVCGIGAVISQLGDLAASAIKRHYNIKDYGHLIPGHGGILDRFDSMIFVAPIVYYLTELI